MPVKPSPHELILLFAIGMKQSQIINLGYSPNTVWKYDKKFKEASNNLVNKIISIQNELKSIKKIKKLENESKEKNEIKAQENKKKIRIKPDDKRLKNPFMKEIEFEAEDLKPRDG